MVIKSNTLPDIFDKKKKRKKKRIDYYVHSETSNKSFLKMFKLLKMLGVENNDFFLALYDTTLIDVDPYDPKLSAEVKMRVLKECMRNMWYFLREVVRIPVAGSGVGEGKRYELHRGNLAINYCVFNNLNSYTELPRQVGKSIAVDCILLWLYNFGTTNSQMLILNKEHKDAKENLKRIMNIRDILPKYLQFNAEYNEKGERLKPHSNKETAKNHKTNNELVTKPSATSADMADNLGRGLTSPVQWFDEFGFLKYNDIIYKAASPAASTASEEAAANGKPFAKIITSTPGDMKTKHGSDAYQFIKDSAVFNDGFYDWDVSEVREFISRNSKNGFLYIKFSYKQLGRSQAYFDKQVTELGEDWAKIRREVLLEWNTMATDSPFRPEDIKDLEAMTRPVVRTITINKYYMLDLYEDIDFDYPTLIACDVASGQQKDNSAIALISTKTKRIVGTFVNNKIDTTNFSAVIFTIATQIVPNSLICIERNNAGDSVIANLKHSNVKSKLFYTVPKDDTKDKIKDGHLRQSSDDTREYGVWTGEKSREAMFEILSNYVIKYKSRIAVDPLVDQIKGLQYTKSGRIDHTANGHDDLVMAYLIGLYAYYYGDISKFGIIRFPDYDEDDDEEERLKEYELEAERKKAQSLNAKVFRPTTVEDIDPELAHLIHDMPEYKTANDRVAEIDRDNNRGFTSQSPFSVGSSNDLFSNMSSESYNEYVRDEILEQYL